MAIREGASTLFAQVQREHAKAGEDLTSLKSGGFLNESEFTAAMGRLEVAFERVIKKFENYISFFKIPVAPLPPPVNRRDVRGIIAFRQWQYQNDDFGQLAPLIVGQRVSWRPIMYADKVPTKNNLNGLYARELLPNLGNAYLGLSSQAFGFVELLGHIEEHQDNVYRAESAKILSLYVPIPDEATHARMQLGLLERLIDSYFSVPTYPVTEYQAHLILMREILISNGVSTY